MMSQIVNIAGYRFVTLTDLPALRQRLREQCANLAIKGTILLSAEGINIMLAGTENAIAAWLELLEHEEKLSAIEFKKSFSTQIPFKRLLVKIKKEIITFAVPEVEPQKMTGKHLPPQQFKQWLDEQKNMVVLDVRNRYEVAAGTFRNAVDLSIDNFRYFANAVPELENGIKQKTVVMFCTGGIRCEKASAYLLQQGFQDVYQLQGGILQYFKECGDAHFNGKCFVFDERELLDGSLQNS